MNKSLMCVVLVSANIGLSSIATADDNLVNEARSHSASLGMALKSALQASMKADGPVAAIDVCNVQAPEIAKQVSTEGWRVARTAVKIRNPSNAADDWEEGVMHDFSKRLSAGENPKTLEASKTENGEFRYMKAIPTAGVCLACHGSELAAPVAKKIASLYPQDTATGFQLGELRGAFTLRKTLKD